MFNKVFIFLLVFQCAITIKAADIATASVQFVNDHSTYCHACFKTAQATVSKTLMKCKNCGHAHYCSRECQREHWQYHKTWCKRKDPVVAPGDMDLKATYSSEQVKLESFNLFSQAYKSTFGLHASMLTKDGFYDQLASNSKIAASLFYQSLIKIVNNGNLSLKKNPKFLLPGMGYLAPAELVAINAVFNPGEIHGFDIDEDAIKFSKASNPSIAANLYQADGMTEKVWQQNSNKEFDAVILLHPLFCELVSGSKRINSIGKGMLGNIKTFLPGTQLIIVTKSLTESRAIVEQLNLTGYEHIRTLENYEFAFPASSYGESLKRANDDIVFNRQTDIVGILLNTDKIPKNQQHWKEAGEYRYSMIILAKSPLPN